MVAVLAVANSACTGDEPDPIDAKVGPAGATVNLSGMSVTVPPGALKSETELVVTSPVRADADEAPFGLNTGTSVHITFRNGAQPADGKPLDVAIPLTGKFRPEGTTPDTALLYHVRPDGTFRLMPATVKDETLHAQLPHLSEWNILYVNNDALTRGFPLPSAARPVSPDSCPVQVTTTSYGKVVIGGGSKGWTKDGPVKPCLSANGDEITLSIKNKINYLLPVAATSGFTLTSPAKDTEEEMVRMLAGKIFPDSRVKTHLGRDGELKATAPASKLPATVELIGDPSTFLAESTWFALKFMVGMIEGKTGSEVVNSIKLIVDTADVLTCLQNTLKISGGNVPSMGDVAELLTSKCTEPITKALEALAPTDWWSQFWKRIGVIADGVVGGWNNFWTAVDGIRMQFNGTVHIEVVRVAICPTATEFQDAAAAANKRLHGAAKSKAAMADCADGWAYGRTQTWLDYGGGMWSDGMQTVMHYSNGTWVVDHLAGSDGLILGEDAVCGKMPAALRNKHCRVG